MGDRLRILGLLRDSPPLLASHIAFKLGLKLESVAAHLGTMRRDGMTSKQKVNHPTAAVRVGHQVFRVSQTFWTTIGRRSELFRVRYLDVRVRKRIPVRHPFTGDTIQMVQDIRNAASQ